MADLDRRSDLRHPAALVPARLRLHHPLRLLDLSAAGARVESTEWIAPGRRYSFRVSAGPELHLCGEVTRCALVRVDDDSDGGSAVYEAGIHFVGLPDTTRAELCALLLGLAAGATEAPVMRSPAAIDPWPARSPRPAPCGGTGGSPADFFG